MKKQLENVSVSKKRKIMTAAKEIIVGKGYHQTSVEEIARRAGIAKGTVYLYFKDKQIIFITLIEEMFDEMISFITQAEKQAGSVRNKLKKLLELELNYMEKNKKFFYLIGQQMQNAEHILEKGLHNSLHNRIKNKFLGAHQLLGKMMKDGVGKKVKHLPMQVITMIFTSIMQSFVFMSVHNVLKKPLMTQADTILDIFFDGVGVK